MLSTFSTIMVRINKFSFSRIIHIVFKDKQRDVVTDAAHFFSQQLQIAYGQYMVGPAEPVVNRVRNMYLMELLLKLPRDAALINQCKKDVLKGCVKLHAEKRFKKVLVVPDVDAV